MAQTTIAAVAGLPGAGKTTWIHQQLTQAQAKGFYCCLASDTVPIDQTYIASEFSPEQILLATQTSQLNPGDCAYIELGFHLDLARLDPLKYRRIAIVPPGITDSEWHDWADEIVEGVPAKTVMAAAQLWQSPLSGNVVDFDSLAVFWSELTQGAYGEVTRAKGIFDIADGQSVSGNFVAGLPDQDFVALNLPRWLEGKPQRFSGLEIWGHLDETAIAQTLQDCCLSSSEIYYYQQQVKQLLLEEAT